MKKFFILIGCIFSCLTTLGSADSDRESSFGNLSTMAISNGRPAENAERQVLTPAENKSEFIIDWAKSSDSACKQERERVQQQRLEALKRQEWESYLASTREPKMHCLDRIYVCIGTLSFVSIIFIRYFGNKIKIA